MARHYENVLAVVVREPQVRISEIAILEESERRQQLEEWNETEHGYGRELCLHQLFEQQAARTPERAALLAADGEYSYVEVNERANRLAHLLLGRGLQPEERVGVMLSRRSVLPVALLAVLKAGGAYVPLDPRYPGARTRGCVCC
jgi:non-ribosomal peptide synthetase component F